ncbi:hypothetical protein [Pantanalinema sp. GBBB05]|uniref:hypothetical protein n=1 Tax=Pantanalinema sp. GBBB05 TaxID=2604139 RepID=UPI001DE7D498|nr:hypothetical protein [Pantanalinema sp. GBBB05]
MPQVTLVQNPILPTESVRVYKHLVTLINRVTEHEVALEIETLSDRFCDVMREIAHQRVMKGLKGYEVFETLDLTELPF